MKILDRLPIATSTVCLDVQAGVVKPNPTRSSYGSASWTIPGGTPGPRSSRHYSTRAITTTSPSRSSHLTRWAGIHPDPCNPGGMIREGTRIAYPASLRTSGFIATNLADEISRTCGLFYCRSRGGDRHLPIRRFRLSPSSRAWTQGHPQEQPEAHHRRQRKHASLRSPLW